MSRALLVLVPALLSTGCVLSLQPIGTEENAVFEPKLVGVWKEPQSKETWAFTRAGEKQYRVQYTLRSGETVTFSGHLARLENMRILDLRVERPDDSENEPTYGFVLPTHWFLRIDQVEPTLQMRQIDYTWLEKLLAHQPDALRHEVIEDRIVLSASTEELQRFLLKYADTKEAFSAPATLKRIKEK